MELKALRKLLILGALASFGGGAVAQVPGSADPEWNTVRQGQRPQGEFAWSGIATQPSGKVLMAARISDGSNVSYRIWRFDRTGSLDASFGSAGTANVPLAGGLVTDGIGRIYSLGSATSDTAGIMRLLPDGAIDPTFGNGQPVSMARTLGDVGVLPTGGIIAVMPEQNSSNVPQFIVATKLRDDGSADASFGVNGVMTLYSAPANSTVGVPDVEVAPDGSFVVQFSQTAGPGNFAARLHRFNANGTPDSSFGTAGAVVAPGWRVNDFELQHDGRILVLLGNDQPATMVARLTPDGRLDSSFGSNGLAAATNRRFTQIEPEADGGIIVATTSMPSGAQGAPALMRLTPAGVVDSSFSSPVLEQPALVQLVLGDGAYAMTFLAGNNLEADRWLYKFVLPRESSRVGVTTDNTPTTSAFRIEAQNLTGTLVNGISTTQVAGLHGFVYPQGTDLNASADLFVVAGTPQGFYMRNTSGAFVRWDGTVSTLVPAYENLQLRDNLHVPVYSGRLPFTGQFQLYLGYMRDGGPLVYTAQPTSLVVTP
ncbi:MAG TPA: hypothetical protein VGE69_06350 [Pseudomonadales bacterium]